MEEEDHPLIEEIQSYLTMGNLPHGCQSRSEWGASLSFRLGGRFDFENPQESLDNSLLLMAAINVCQEEEGCSFPSPISRANAHKLLRECYPTVWDHILRDPV
jgi:hypothetical protein